MVSPLQDIVASVVRNTELLFTRPYDEQWLDAMQKRIAFERKNRLDIRSRGAVNRALLSGINKVLARRTFSSKRHLARSIDIATRVLMYDSALAATYHHTAKMRSVSKSSETLRQTSGELSAVCDAIENETSRATLAAGSTIESVLEAANRTQTLSRAIGDLERVAGASADMASEAASRMDKTNERIKSLSTAVDSIGSIVSVIANVAGQTKLLALNATIEAARAGEYGRGFTVVAQEVKGLAAQTSQATTQIAELIDKVTSTTLHAVTDMEGAGEHIKSVAAASNRVADIVREQATSSNIAAVVTRDTASQAEGLRKALSVVTASIGRTTGAARLILDLSMDLAAQAGTLDEAVEDLFMTTRKNEAIVGPLKNILADMVVA
jgi:methyl-accepting chemotaxis protein